MEGKQDVGYREVITERSYSYAHVYDGYRPIIYCHDAVPASALPVPSPKPSG